MVSLGFVLDVTSVLRQGEDLGHLTLLFQRGDLALTLVAWI
jgi:hypothetical protein